MGLCYVWDIQLHLCTYIKELCEGGSLEELLRDPEEVLDEPTQARIAAETATGIAYLHMRDVSIVHGDIKSGNVLLTKERAVRICDFGMSEAKDRSKTMTVAGSAAEGERGRARGGAPAVTVAWSAPELFKDQSKSFASDVYALGLTLWEIYERRIPFGNMPEAAVVNQVLAGERPNFTSSSVMPAAVRDVVEACWSAGAKARSSLHLPHRYAPSLDCLKPLITDSCLYKISHFYLTVNLTLSDQ